MPPKSQKRASSTPRTKSGFRSITAILGSVVATPLTLLFSAFVTVLLFSHYGSSSLGSTSTSYLQQFLSWLKTAVGTGPLSGIVTDLSNFLLCNIQKFGGFLVISLGIILTRRQRVWEYVLLAGVLIWFFPVLSDTTYILFALFIAIHHLAIDNTTKLFVAVVFIIIVASRYPSGIVTDPVSSLANCTSS